MKSMKDLANELVENFDKCDDGVYVSFLKTNPKDPITEEDMSSARKIWENIKE